MVNEKLIAELDQLREISELLGNAYKEKAYRKAVTELRKLKSEITRSNIETFSMVCVGPGIRAKITEFATSGHIAELDERAKEYRAYKELSGIAGVGPATVRSWMKKKIFSLAQLRQAIAKGRVELNTMQKYGLMFYDDLNSRIPRAEVAAIGDYIKRVLIQLDPGVVSTIAGSYRRNAETSGDIDILASNRDGFVNDLLPNMVAVLRGDDNFVATLSSGTERVTFLYRSPVSGKVRQVDVLNIPHGSYYAALNYFTGSLAHNERLRGIAKAKGYRLNQNGLFKYAKNKKDLTLVPTNSEEEIYRILGVEYIPPALRA